MKNYFTARLLPLFLCLSLLLCVASGCKEAERPVTVDIESLGADLSQAGFVEPVQKLDVGVIGTLYGFTSGADRVVVYSASGATPEEIIVAEYQTGETAAQAVEKYEKHLETMKKTFDSYNAQYRPLLNRAILVRIGRYVVYCVCDDPEEAERVIAWYRGDD